MVATRGKVERMKQQLQSKFFKASYGAQFPTQIYSNQRLAEPLSSSNENPLWGRVLRANDFGSSDIYDTTVLWAADLW
jgi:hypothetical protein